MDGTRRHLVVAAACVTWLALVAFADPRLGLAGQRALGALTWTLVVILLAGEDGATRCMVLLAAAAAGTLELVPQALELYRYRLGNIPSFVPPGHGLVFLGSLALSRSTLFTARPQTAIGLTIAAAGAWALWGLTLASRPDTAGALFVVLWVGLLAAGRAPALYAAAFVVTSAVEIAGTQTGSWTWAPHDPAGLLSAGNPPSGVAGIYGFVDVAVLAAGPYVLRAVARLRSLSPIPRPLSPIGDQP